MPKLDKDKTIFPDVQCSTCFFYHNGHCQLSTAEVDDQDSCSHYQFDALCVDCGNELGESFMVIEGYIACKCVCCGAVSVGPAGIKYDHLN